MSDPADEEVARFLRARTVDLVLHGTGTPPDPPLSGLIPASGLSVQIHGDVVDLGPLGAVRRSFRRSIVGAHELEAIRRR